ncbi:hypothetical protein [Pseudomonas sp. W5-01]|uniref:hypothetical protein n=1 Tax=Pseudomonas sp. W5-01 TaxID=3097454 RepID=UPI00397C1976
MNKLMGTLASAQTREQIKREGAIELGFEGGVETAQYLRASDIEALYVMFEEAVQARLQALGAG